MSVDATRLMDILNATPGDIEVNNAWINNWGGTARNYIAPDPTGQFAIRQQTALNKAALAEDTNLRQAANGANIVAYVNQRGAIVGGMTYNEIPAVANNIFYPQYDGNHGVEGSDYPAPH